MASMSQKPSDTPAPGQYRVANEDICSEHHLDNNLDFPPLVTNSHVTPVGERVLTPVGNDVVRATADVAVTDNAATHAVNETVISKVHAGVPSRKNRMAYADCKLQFINTGTGMLKFGFDEIDSVEKTYGICLLGCVIGGKPPTAALVDLVRRWGPDIKFQTHDFGWIIFTFPSIEAKERILSGRTYMVFGFHLFLKEMPRCFRFREEDIESEFPDLGANQHPSCIENVECKPAPPKIAKKKKKKKNKN